MAWWWKKIRYFIGVMIAGKNFFLTGILSNGMKAILIYRNIDMSNRLMIEANMLLQRMYYALILSINIRVYILILMLK